MNKDLNLLMRLHEIYESKLLLFSADYDCLEARKEYEHEYTETKAILELISRLVDVVTERKDLI